MEQRYRRMEHQKPWPGLAHNQDFVKGRELKPKVKKSKSGDLLSGVVLFKQITNWNLGAEPPASDGYRAAA